MLTAMSGDLEQTARLARALADPIRLAMLEIMSREHGCCCFDDPASRGVPGPDPPQGVCVCEFQERLDLAQSKASYHLRVLRDAGLVTEETRGKWSFYALDRRAAADALGDLGRVLDT